MLIKVKRNWKDFAEPCSHGSSRREFIKNTLYTGMLGVALNPFAFVERALAQTLNCPSPSRNLGSIAQIFSEGGPTMGARFIGDAQAAAMNVEMASHYGISGQANLRRLGPNMNIDVTSPFGFTLLQGPPGYAGGPQAWQANVLSKISGGAHLGPFNADDGAGQDTGLLGGVSPFKSSVMGKDIRIGARNAVAAWANGLPSASLGGGGNLTPANLAKTFTLTPAPAGLINSEALTAASDGANALSQAMAPVFKSNERKGFRELASNSGCAFYGNSALADPNYGTQLFTATGITALTGKMNVANLSNPEQAQLAAFYQSAAGVAGGVVLQFGGRDYHGGNPQTDIAPKDIEEARSIVMFLAACDAAGAPGAMLYFSNGQAIADGVQGVTATINGANVNLNAPRAQGDAGGSYNAGLVIFFNPKGAAPMARFTGTLNAQNGNVKIDPNIGSSEEAVAGLYLSALSFINNGNLPAKALEKMQAAGVAANPSKIMVI